MGTRSIVIAVFAALVLASASEAQQRSQGLLVGTPGTALVGPNTHDASGPMNPREFHRRRAGVGNGWLAQGPDDDAEDPAFDMTAALGGGGEPPFRINAWSLGQDYVFATEPAGGIARVLFTSTSWGVLAFSVRRSTVGEPGSVIAMEAAQPGGAGGDVFTYIPEEATFPDAGLSLAFPTDQVQRALDSSEMGFVGSPELAGLDLFAPLFESGDPVDDMLPDEPRLMFSVAKPERASVPAGWFGATAPSAASILEVAWDPLAMAWGTPSMAVSFDELGLLVSDDVDALSVDRARGLILFSVVHRPGLTLDHQLQIASWTPTDAQGGVETGIWVTGEGVNEEAVARRVELNGGEEIDSVCTDDPGGQGEPFKRYGFGRPTTTVSILPVLSANIYRDDDDTFGSPQVTLVVADLPQTLPPGASLWLVLTLTDPGATPDPGDDTVWPLPPVNFGPAPLLGGNEVFTVPLPVPELVTPNGLLLDCFWAISNVFPRPTSPVMRITI